MLSSCPLDLGEFTNTGDRLMTVLDALFYLPLVFPEDFRTIGPIVPSLIYSDFLLVGIPFRHF
jgi:hypothetical protein